MNLKLRQEIAKTLLDVDTDRLTIDYMKSMFPYRNVELYNDYRKRDFMSIICKIDDEIVRIDYDSEIIFLDERFCIRSFLKDGRQYAEVVIENNKRFDIKQSIEFHNLNIPENWLEWTDADLLLFRMSI